MNVYIKDPYVAKYVTGEKVSISSMFYEQLLLDPKSAKMTDSFTIFF